MNEDDDFRLRNPKRNGSCRVGRSAWYPYYAGYSPEFVEDSIESARRLGVVSSVLDPWNGSGTTTQVARSCGISAEGFDLNPAMVIVAKAKMLNSSVHASIPSLLDDICVKARTLRGSDFEDPLTIWLSLRSSGIVRSIDRAISMLLVDRTKYSPLGALVSFKTVSSLASFFYMALFRALRSLVKPFVGSNPTWIRRPVLRSALLNISASEITASFRKQVFSLHRDLVSEFSAGLGLDSIEATVDIASSLSLPVADKRFGLVVSSPPYCTRIDYAIKTGPELAVLGIGPHAFRELREGMIGTPTISSVSANASRSWGRSCVNILDAISHHEAKASKSYYWKTYSQYFDGLFRSIREISRVLRPNGLCFLVVQDSFYKELHVDLARIASEMASESGLWQKHRSDFRATRTMAGLNTVSRGYNKSYGHTESILVWERSGDEWHGGK